MAHRRDRSAWEESNIRLQRAVNRWGARIIPAILIGLVGFSVWGFGVVLAINHLLLGRPRNLGAGIPILVLYFVFLVLMGICYLRLLQTILTNPGYVPLPESEMLHRQGKSRRKKPGSDARGISNEKDGTIASSQYGGYMNQTSVSNGRLGPPPGLEQFYTRDIFECEVDGLPRWCSGCQTWKPDRSHHSSEVGRCVYKMDHFCPWAGGIISETSFKFFVQFLVYGAMFCALLVAVSVYYTVEEGRQERYHAPWIVVIGLAALFLMFALGMGSLSIVAACRNATTVDNLTLRNRVYHFAVLIPNPQAFTIQPYSQPETMTYPPHPATAPILPTVPPAAATSIGTMGSQHPQAFPPQHLPYHTITYPLSNAGSSTSPITNATMPVPNSRTFAVLSTPQGTNPYRLKSPLANFKEVMGNSFADWLLPLRHSPCYGRRRTEGGYPFGPVVEKMIRDAGLSVPGDAGGRRGV